MNIAHTDDNENDKGKLVEKHLTIILTMVTGMGSYQKGNIMSINFSDAAASILNNNLSQEEQPPKPLELSEVRSILTRALRAGCNEMQSYYHNRHLKDFELFGDSDANTGFRYSSHNEDYLKLVRTLKYLAQLDTSVNSIRQDGRATLAFPRQDISKLHSPLIVDIAVYISPVEWGEQVRIKFLEPEQVKSFVADYEAYKANPSKKVEGGIPLAANLIREMISLEASEVFIEDSASEVKAVIRRGTEALKELYYSQEEYTALLPQIKEIASISPRISAYKTEEMDGNPVLRLLGYSLVLGIRFSMGSGEKENFLISTFDEETVKDLAYELRNTTDQCVLWIRSMADLEEVAINRDYFTWDPYIIR